ncbi:MAG TPA: helix-turn-helix domain-containing protein [Casimicrobiaceae bacterium]|nr:helix-turn-helix domain-containing protein [Casimicrobiaceae bacterium]
MHDGPSIARIAALIGDHARAHMLTSLLSGEALTATELAQEAGVTPQTVSTHLAKLVDARLLSVERQGRHRYFRLAGHDVAHALESLMNVATRTGATRVRPGPREPALRKARVCYDHLAGAMGVGVYDALLATRVLRDDGDGPALTPKGRAYFAEFGIDVDALARERRPLCRACLDWSVRRHHLAGALGAALLRRVMEQGWARRVRHSRVVAFTPPGERAMHARFATLAQPAMPGRLPSEARDSAMS